MKRERNHKCSEGNMHDGCPLVTTQNVWRSLSAFLGNWTVSMIINLRDESKARQRTETQQNVELESARK